MELKAEEGSLGFNPIFPESSQTLLDRNHHLQQNPSTLAQVRPAKTPNPDQFIGGGERIEQKPSRSSLKAAALPDPTSKSSGVRYRECLKNHAASVGGNVLDGCGEFMATGDEGTPEALKCAVCNCHRNFHRKEVDGGGGGGETDFARSAMLHPLQLPLPLPLPPPLPSPSLNQHHQRISVGMHSNHWTPIVRGGNGGTDSSSEDLNFNGFRSNAAPPPPPPPPFVLSKKRSRTKFTQDQKTMMLEYAEKVGWRIPKADDAEVQRFCAEVGVKRQVLKVWMHNNKNFNKKQEHHQQEES